MAMNAGLARFIANKKVNKPIPTKSAPLKANSAKIVNRMSPNKMAPATVALHPALIAAIKASPVGVVPKGIKAK